MLGYYGNTSDKKVYRGLVWQGIKIVNFLKSEGKKFGKNTVYSYVEKLQDTQAVFFVKLISGTVYVKESWPRKVYICDSGISTLLRFSDDTGRLMENPVFLELKRMQNERPMLDIYYYRDYQQREVDALLKVSGEFKCKKLTIITWDYECELALTVENKQIHCIPLWKWLIEN